MNKTVFPKVFIFVLLLIPTFVLISCTQSKKNEVLSGSDPEEQQIDIHLPAMYTGTLPCADCPEINYRLIIEKDRFVEISRYQDRPTEPFEETGSWKTRGDTLTLTQSNAENFHKKFLIEEDILTLLDSENQQIIGDLTNMYVLERTGNQPTIREHHERLADEGFKFFAGGNEPFWSLKIDSVNTVIYETPESTKRFENADSSKTENKITMKAGTDSMQITIQTEDTYCQDSMSGYLFPREVNILLQTTRKDTLTGCGLFLNG